MKNLAFLLIISTFAERLVLPISLGGEVFNLKLTQILLFASIIVFLFKDLTQQKQLFRFDKFDILITLYFLTNLFSSIIVARDFNSVKGSLVVLSYVLIYFTTKRLIEQYYGVNDLMSLLNKANFVSIVFGLLSFAFTITSGQRSFGVALGHLKNGIPSIKSLSWEPNLFAIITGSLFLINLLVYIQKKGGSFIWLLLQFIAIVLSFTRSVYLSIIICIVMLMYFAKGKVKKGFFQLMVLSIIPVFILLIAFNDSLNIQKVIIERVAGLSDFDQGSSVTRLSAYELGLEEFKQSPLIGKGTMSANTKVYHEYKNEYVDISGSEGWLTGLWIQSLHDTGIVGMLVVVLIFRYLVFENLKIYRLIMNYDSSSIYFLGFALSNVLIFISTNISSIMWSPFVYVFWAINLSMLRFVKYKFLMVNNENWYRREMVC